MDAAAPTPALIPDTVPAPARRWAHGALALFVLFALLAWLVRADAQPYVTTAMSAYAAALLSFLGGVHWGAAMRARAVAPPAYVAGVLPPVGAWVAVMMPPEAGLALHGGLFVASYLVDRKRYPEAGLSRWLTLRFRVSAVASLACFVGAAGA
jgi:hypothetical protein